MKANKEIEIKIFLENKKVVQKKLMALGWKINNLEFQKTFRLWKPDHSLAENGIFPRTRKEGVKSTFTVKVNTKGSVNENDKNRKYFERDEYEIEVSDAEKLAHMLSILGLNDQRILEKYRQEWGHSSGAKSLEVMIDTLPFASFLELEGKKNEIEKLLKQLGLVNAERITLAYWRVYKAFCKKYGTKEKQNLIFKDESK